MRFLLITDWPALVGGVERYVVVTARALRARGHEVRLMTSAAGSAGAGAADYVAFGTERRAVLAGLQVVNPSAVATVRRALRDHRPDAVLVNTFMAQLSPAILRELRDVPSMLIVHDYKPICMNSTRLLPNGSACHATPGVGCWRGGCVSLGHYARDRLRYRILHDGLAHITHVRTISRSMQAELRRGGIAADAMALPVAPPDARYRRAPAPAPLFAYGGRLARVKGVDLLLRAFARVLHARPDARLRISGDGPQAERLERLAVDLAVHDAIEWDRQMRDGWADTIGDAWAVVTPSVFREPLNLVAIEAIARGVPVIAASAGGLAETVEHGISGTLVEPSDERALARAMLAACARPETVPQAVALDVRRRHDPDAHAVAVAAPFEAGRAAA